MVSFSLECGHQKLGNLEVIPQRRQVYNASRALELVFEKGKVTYHCLKDGVSDYDDGSIR